MHLRCLSFYHSCADDLEMNVACPLGNGYWQHPERQEGIPEG